MVLSFILGLHSSFCPRFSRWIGPEGWSKRKAERQSLGPSFCAGPDPSLRGFLVSSRVPAPCGCQGSDFGASAFGCCSAGELCVRAHGGAGRHGVAVGVPVTSAAPWFQPVFAEPATAIATGLSSTTALIARRVWAGTVRSLLRLDVLS